ncbi:DUF4435 domain-containing protein [Chromohalobacter israelensis]|uniref:DUF4435 domain-containing protein n=1 Tax=Chromohalobacter israelensis TaxID=141390 RepID=UPI000D719860|nr:DUF4435 domain-containing protein [Chromohalobacter salexigens]PWW31599.1 uncharacterized protein DUF4435 [Chromohalobacter salexigens]
MAKENPRPTFDELFELLRRTSLPTVLVEGVDDIIFYRKIEEDLSYLNIDVLPAGNKDCVLRLMEKLEEEGRGDSVAFVVDKDLWVHGVPDEFSGKDNLITTYGYSIENDLFVDGKLLDLLSINEAEEFMSDVNRFIDWYALAVDRVLSGRDGAFRTHPGKVLDDAVFFDEGTRLEEEELYPDNLRKEIESDYQKILRGKSLISIINRQLSKNGRDVKFSGRQLMAFGGSRRGSNFERLKGLIANAF